MLKRAIKNTLTDTVVERGRNTPSLSMDFINQKYYVQQNEFSRASTATYWAYDGILRTAEIDRPRFEYDPATGSPIGFLKEESATNLLLRSEEFDDAAWTTGATATVSSDVEVAPDGNTTADKYIPNNTTANFVLYQSINVLAGTTYTYSLFVKGAEYTTCALLVLDGPNPRADFDVSAGTIGNTSGGNLVSQAIRDVGNGWYRCSITWDAIEDESVQIRFYDRNPGSRVGDGSSGIYVWGAQVEEGNTATNYIPTTGSTVTREADLNLLPPYSNNTQQTFEDLVTFTRASDATYWDSNGVLQVAVTDEPRFDFSPSDLTPAGILLEETRTNVTAYSIDLLSWAQTSKLTLSGGQLAPDGTMSAVKLQDDATGGASGNIYVQDAHTVNALSEYTASVFIKADQTSSLIIRTSNDDDVRGGEFDISTSTFTPINSETGEITQLGNGWYRCQVTWQTGNDTAIALRLAFPSTNVDGTNSVIVWGVQLEEGNFATSFIYTDGTPATREKDVATVDQLTEWFSDAAEMTMYGEWLPFDVPDSNNTWHSIRNSTGVLAGYFGFYNTMNTLIYTTLDSSDVKTFTYTRGDIMKTVLSINGFSYTSRVGDVSKTGDSKSFGAFTHVTNYLELSNGTCNGHLRVLNFNPLAIDTESLNMLTL